MSGSPATVAVGELPSSNSNYAASIIAAVERLGNAQIITEDRMERGDHAAFIVLPTGQRIESLKPIMDQFAPTPERIAGTARLLDEQSFTAHVQEFKEPTTSVFANPSFQAPSFLAVYDYHALSESDEQMPAWCAHRAEWKLTLSKEWQSWVAQQGKAMSHQDFAEFLERHIPDVYWGDEQSEYTKALVSTLELKLGSPSSLLALSRNLAINVESSVKSVQTLSSGEVALTYIETHKDEEGKPIKVPNAFLIAIPVIQGGPPYQILARLRYRMAGQRVSWFYDLHRLDITFDAVVREISERVQSTTGCTVFLGAPES